MTVIVTGKRRKWLMWSQNYRSDVCRQREQGKKKRKKKGKGEEVKWRAVNRSVI